MLKLLFRQPLNIWRTLELRYKLEAILLFILIYTYMATRFNSLFEQWSAQGATDIGIVLIISNFFTLTIAFSALLIIRWFFPKQKAVNLFISKPLNNQKTIKILTYYALKYLSTYVILLLPVLTALYVRFGIYPLFLSMCTVLVIGYTSLLILFRIKNLKVSNIRFILYCSLLIVIYHGLFSVVYWQMGMVHLFQWLAIGSAVILSWYLYRNNTASLLLENFLSYKQSERTKPVLTHRKVSGLIRILPVKIQALLEKEISCLWRNQYYRKLKIRTLIIFIFLNIFLFISNAEHKEIWLAILTCLTIWGHYSNNFNEKYVIADPDWFIRTLPIKFRHLFFAKYLAEISYIAVIMLLDIILLQFAGIDYLNIFYTITFIIIFANLVLYTMLNFQIMFYNNTRLAAYAYHFSLMFMVIMIFNYRLVGPIIALGLSFFFLYKNVKYFNN